MSKQKNIIAIIIIICSLLGLNYIITENQIIIENNQTINHTELENKTIEEIINIIVDKNETLKERINEFEYRKLIDCDSGIYQYHNLTVEIQKISSYDVCLINLKGDKNFSYEFLFRLRKNKNLSEYVKNMDSLEEIRSKIKKVNVTIKKEKEIGIDEFKTEKVLKMKQMTGPYTYLVEVEETIEKWEEYDKNPYITNYFETGKEMQIIDFIEILKKDVCEMYLEWEEKWNMPLNPENDYVYQKLKGACEYEV